MSKLSLILLLAGACSYQESVGSSSLTGDAGTTMTGDAVSDGRMASPNILSDNDGCGAFSVRASEVYCLSTEPDAAATDSRGNALVRRITDDEHIVIEGTLPAVYGVDSSLAQDASRVYLSVELSPETSYVAANWAIYAFDKQQHTFAQLIAGLDQRPENLLVVNGKLYFFARQSVPPNTVHEYEQLFELSLTDSSPVKLITNTLGNIVQADTDGAYIYATDIGKYLVTAVAIAAPHRVLTLHSTGEPWDSAAPAPFALRVHGDWVYYGTQGVGEIHRVPRPAPGATQDSVSAIDERIAGGMLEPFSIAATDTDLYFTEYFYGLSRVPLDGSAPQQILVSFGNQGNGALGLDGDRIYFTARHTNNIGGMIAKYRIAP